ncbi:MAG: alanine racemase, partial [Acidobacteriales bacterium]|nr:alanine racemase [Terriglobales bacterium]
LERLGADALAVALPEEALVLRRAGVKSPLLLLNGFWPGQEDEIIQHQLTPVVFRQDMLDSLEKAAARAKRQVVYHLEVNTGISRLGVEWEEASSFLARNAGTVWARCEGVFTHFSLAESIQDGSTETQLERFTRFLEAAEQGGLRTQWRHAANSAGILNFRQSWMDSVRPGLAVFGVNPLPSPQNALALSPVLRFKSQVMQVRVIRSGCSIGYGNAFTATRDSIIATLSVGYADGLMRALSNCGHVLIRGRRAPIAGKISMDLTLVDATEVPSVEVGDEAVLIGKQGNFEIRVEELAGLVQTIPYEILTRIGPRVPRLYLGQDTVMNSRPSH